MGSALQFCLLISQSSEDLGGRCSVFRIDETLFSTFVISVETTPHFGSICFQHESLFIVLQIFCKRGESSERCVEERTEFHCVVF